MRSLARICIRHRRITLASWLGLLVACAAVALSLGDDFATNFELPESESQRAFEVLEERFPSRSGDSFQVVFHATEGTLTDPAKRQRVAAVLSDLRAREPVVEIAPPDPRAGTVSPDGTIGFATARIEGRSFDVPDARVEELIEIGERADGGGLEVELGGDLIRFSREEGQGAEVVGVLAAIVVLLITFGSVVAMWLPILTALIALGTTLSLVTILTNLVDTADFAPAMAAMIGLGVGIDYALFIVTRFRTNLSHGMEANEAVLVAMDTAGRAVGFAGATVCVSLLGLFAIGVDFLYGPALAAAIAVLTTMTASITLLPAVLSRVGSRIDRWQVPRFGGERKEEGELWSRLSRTIQRHPWPAAVGATAALLALAIPVLSIELGSPDAGTDEEGTTTRAAYDLLAEGFGPGFNGPLLVVSQLDPDEGPPPRRTLGRLTERLEGTDGVASVAEPRVAPGADAAVVSVIPTTGPQDVATQELVERLRGDTIQPFETETGVRTLVGGETAVTVDFSSFIAGKLPLFMAVVITLSALLLLVAFRAILVSLKAIAMNALSIAASFGIVVAVFQFGWGNELIGLEETAPIAAFLPVFVFAIVFGLSMDYEVFLISRVHEEWERRRDASGAVQHGLASTGRVITAAALIMICVFSSFALGGDLTIKLFGVGLAAAIAIDAFVIRSLLVPAIMELLGSRAWWIPAWLDRLLPRVRIEAEGEPGRGVADREEAGERARV